MVVAVAAALHEGSRAIICASTGNTSASAAAYGGRFGMRTVVVVPRGHIASGKLVQATGPRRDRGEHQTADSTSHSGSCASSANTIR